MTNVTPSRSIKLRVQLLAFALQLLAAFVPAQAPSAPTLPAGSEALQVPAGHVVSYRTFALGVQIYRFDPVTTQWTFVAPSALLFANAGCQGLVGVHFAGPTWMTMSGSSVQGQRLAGSTVDPTAIPWLLLGAVSPHGPGVLAPTRFVQRVNTAGGLAPARLGFPGEIAMVPYTAQYYFYRAQ